MLLLRAVAAIMIALPLLCVLALGPIKTAAEPSTTNNRWRDITSGEAHVLLKAFLKRADGDIQEYDPQYPDGTRYPAFYFLEAELGVSPGPVGVLDVRYYAVDRQTGDVWNAVICEVITSSSLTRAQVALRRRIGLIDAEYRRIKKLGPLCEPGNPRIGPGK